MRPELPGLTLDTGALIALERGTARIRAILTGARIAKRPVTVPAPVLIEWWRGQRGPVARFLDGVYVEPLTAELARTAGEALAVVGSGPSPTDAAVMASAARRGDIVYTADVEDLAELQRVFPTVRLLRV